jgi:hypothetical protein
MQIVLPHRYKNICIEWGYLTKSFLSCGVIYKGKSKEMEKNPE